MKEVRTLGIERAVMVTHSQRDASYADRIINLFDGQIVDSLAERM